MTSCAGITGTCHVLICGDEPFYTLIYGGNTVLREDCLLTMMTIKDLMFISFFESCISDCVSCQVFGDEADMYKIEDVQIQDLGKVGEITITKDDCLLMKVKSSSI